jgi:predicted transcriptional regulator of viral defense system
MIGSFSTASQSILSMAASDHRNVVSLWRTLIYLRRASRILSPDERRWQQVPETEGDVSPFLLQMQRRGLVERVQGTRGVYRITAPFAQAYGTDERDVLFEINPYTVISHYSALVFHGVTWDQPQLITAISGRDWSDTLIPLGTEASEWEGLSLPAGSTPPKVMRIPVRWRPGLVHSALGVEIHSTRGVPLRYTSFERTLVESLQDPKASGGIMNVLRAWSVATDRLDVDAVVAFTDAADVAVLRLRVGYLLEELGFSHPELDRWAEAAGRGGSNRLVGSEPLAPVYSSRWSLSLNAPVHVLHDEGWE